MKNHYFRFFSLSLIAILFISCETNKHISVTVLNSLTKQPIDSVFVKVNAGKNGDYNKNNSQGFTNSAGKFDTYMMIGCAFGCYDIYVSYSKEGYQEKKDLNITEGTIELIPQ
jgi:hypothetical protein